jgi:hypothetical protein
MANSGGVFSRVLKEGMQKMTESYVQAEASKLGLGSEASKSKDKAKDMKDKMKDKKLKDKKKKAKKKQNKKDKKAASTSDSSSSDDSSGDPWASQETNDEDEATAAIQVFKVKGTDSSLKVTSLKQLEPRLLGFVATGLHQWCTVMNLMDLGGDKSMTTKTKLKGLKGSDSKVQERRLALQQVSEEADATWTDALLKVIQICPAGMFTNKF